MKSKEKQMLDSICRYMDTIKEDYREDALTSNGRYIQIIIKEANPNEL